MAAPWSLGAHEPYLARTTAPDVRQISLPQCDSYRQSIRQNDGKKGEVYGFDGGKRVKGRRRHVLVDSLGLLLKVVVTAANTSERLASTYALMELWDEYQQCLKRVQVLWVDGGYSGDKFALAIWLIIQARVEVIQRDGPEFEILPKRWVVERTFGWLNWYGHSAG